MKSKLMRLLLVVLLIGTVSLLSGCGKSEPEQAVVNVVEEQAPAEETFELHGDYAIDISNLGMALTFYLRIEEDNSFQLSANRAFSDNRGSGTIGELDGTYMMIYSDSTPEKSKTATFERIGPNLIFRSTLPYGSANIMFEKEDDENPEIIYHLAADKYVYEEYYDTYLGFETVGGVDYEYVLTLGAGAKYSFVSSQDGAETAAYQEKGSFAVKNDTLLITPEDEEELTGSITAERALELAVKPEAGSERRTVLFRVATTAQHAGSWYGAREDGTTAHLALDYFGGYRFSVNGQSESYVETGSFGVNGGTLSFTKDGEATAITGVKTGYVLEASFNGVDWVCYDGAILGEFGGGTMVNEAYLATLQMNADGSYSLMIMDQESESELVNESGLFTIAAGPMAYMITLNSDDESVRVGEIWPTGFNMTFDIAGTNYSFLLTK